MKRVAIIGCGHIAQVHAWVLKQLENVEIVAFSDIVPDLAKEMSEKYTFGMAAVFEDYEKMLASVKPDVVHICTPHYLHVPMAIHALEKQISVFMEKPPAITWEEFSELKTVSTVSKGRIGFCFQNRYNSTTKELDRIVAEGKLGSVIGARGFVTWRRDEDYYSDDWHGTLAREGGGALMNQSIHTLDLMLRYLGKPVKIEGSMHNHHLKGRIEVEDTVEAYMEFALGQRACLYATTGYVTDAPVILELSFEKGYATMMDSVILVTGQGNITEKITCDSTSGIGKSYWGNGHLLCIRDFYDALSGKRPYQNDIEGVKDTILTVTDIYKKALNHQ